jgi:hypothetical protein
MINRNLSNRIDIRLEINRKKIFFVNWSLNRFVFFWKTRRIWRKIRRLFWGISMDLFKSIKSKRIFTDKMMHYILSFLWPSMERNWRRCSEKSISSSMNRDELFIRTGWRSVDLSELILAYWKLVQIELHWWEVFSTDWISQSIWISTVKIIKGFEDLMGQLLGRSSK